MSPWKGLLLTMGGVQLAFPESFGRGGTWLFYTYVAGAMFVTSYVKPEYVSDCGTSNLDRDLDLLLFYLHRLHMLVEAAALRTPAPNNARCGEVARAAHFMR